MKDGEGEGVMVEKSAVTNALLVRGSVRFVKESEKVAAQVARKVRKPALISRDVFRLGNVSVARCTMWDHGDKRRDDVSVINVSPAISGRKFGASPNDGRFLRESRRDDDLAGVVR